MPHAVGERRRWLLLAGALMVQGLPVAAQDAKLVCEVRCSQEKLRTAIATISWTGTEQATGARAVRAGAGGAPELDVTVFRRGFARGDFATIDSLARGAAPAPRARPAGAGGAVPPPLRAFEFSVSDVRAETPTAGGNAARPASTRTERVLVEVEGLEPGVRYTWRLRLPGQTDSTAQVSCEAPVCTADLRHPEDQP